MNTKSSLFLFTNNYPFDNQYTEISFLQNEITVLEKIFDVYLIPTNQEGNLLTRSKEFNVIFSFSKYLTQYRNLNVLFKLISSLKYKYFASELIKCKSIKDVYGLILTTHQILTVYSWAKKNSKLLFKSERPILYTYWNTNVTLGLEYFIDKNNKDCKIVSRAHGQDLYLDRKKNNHYYQIRLKYLDKLFLVSKAGKIYLDEKFPEYSNKFIVSYLGTVNNSTLKKKVDNESFHLVSCSTINSIKRVDVIYQSVMKLALNSNFIIKWTHLGGGPLENDLLKLIESNRNKIKNLYVEITGVLLNDEIHRFYANHFVDCFIHASKSEGGVSIAIVEAQSYGIPVVSTNVGGVPEVLDSNNGKLVSENASPDEIVKAVSEIIFDDNTRATLSLNARNKWKTHFEANNNFLRFANELKKIIND